MSVCTIENEECIELGYCLTELKYGPHLSGWGNSPDKYCLQLPCKHHYFFTGVCHDCAGVFLPKDMKVVCTYKGIAATVCSECCDSRDSDSELRTRLSSLRNNIY